MNTKKTSLLSGIIIAVTFGATAQTQPTPPSNTQPPPAAPASNSTPTYGNHLPGPTAPYTTPPVIQQTSPPVAPNPPPFPAGPTYTTTPAKPAPFPPPRN